MDQTYKWLPRKQYPWNVTSSVRLVVAAFAPCLEMDGWIWWSLYFNSHPSPPPHTHPPIIVPGHLQEVIQSQTLEILQIREELVVAKIRHSNEKGALQEQLLHAQNQVFFYVLRSRFCTPGPIYIYIYRSSRLRACMIHYRCSGKTSTFDATSLTAMFNLHTCDPW